LQALSPRQIGLGLGFFDIGARDDSNFKALLGLLELALNGFEACLRSIKGFTRIEDGKIALGGAQYQGLFGKAKPRVGLFDQGIGLIDTLATGIAIEWL
jgi:hypothetical protein